MRSNLKFFATILGTVVMGMLLPTLAFAASQANVTIDTGIPGLYQVSTIGPCGWVVDFYNFALIIGGILAFGAVVFGGILYATSAGNASRQSEGRSWIWSALIGLLLLGGAYLILYTINPSLTKCSLPTLSALSVTGTGGNGTTPTSTTPASGGNGSCKAPTTGPCTVANLQQTCLSSNAQTFAGICGHESGGAANLPSGTDYCNGPVSGQKYSVSIGLFQINLTNSYNQTQVDGQNCSAAFNGQAIHCSGKSACTGSTGAVCQVTNVQLYNDCVTSAQNANSNINAACQLSNNGSSFGPWKADSKACGF